MQKNTSINLYPPPSIEDGLLKVRASIIVRDMVSKKRILGNSWPDTIVFKAFKLGKECSISTYNPFQSALYEGIEKSLLVKMADAFSLGSESK